MENALRNILWVVATVMFIVGAVLGIAWGVSNLLDKSIIESGMQTTITLRILCVLFFGSAGLFHMLSFGDYKRRREIQWEKDRG